MTKRSMYKPPVGAGTQYQEKEFTGFAGLNNKYSNVEIADNEAEDVMNVDFDARGAITKRKGYTLLLAMTSQVSSIIPFYRTTGQRVMLLTNGNSITAYDPVSTTKTTLSTTLNANGARFTGATFYDKQYLLNGNSSDGLMRYDGTSFGKVVNAVNGVSVPNGKFLLSYANRMYITGDPNNANRIYMSDQGLPESWPALNFIDIISDNTGDQITGISQLGNAVVIFKEHNIFLLLGTDPSNYKVVNTFVGVGTVSHFSIAKVPNGLLFLARDGVYLFNGKTATLVSDKIQGSVNNWNPQQLQNAVAFVYNHRYWLSVPEGVGQQVNNYTYIFSYEYGWWTRYNLGMQASCAFQSTNMQPTPLFTDTTGNILQGDHGDNDNGASIDAYLLTKAYDFGTPAHMKAFKQIFTFALAQTGNYSLNLSFIEDFGLQSKTIQMPLSYTSPTQWGNFKWGQAVWGGIGEIAHSSTNVPGQAKYLQFKVEGNGADAPFTFLGWVVRFKVKRRMN